MSTVSTDSGLGLEEEEVERERRRIEPDTGAVTSLLNFDEVARISSQA